MQVEVDEILRRSNFKIRMGLAGQQDPKKLWDRAISAEEAVLPPKAKASHARKAAGSLSVAHKKLLEVEQEDEINAAPVLA